MQQQQGECCRGELCQCSINAHLNLREFGGIATSITLHQNTFQSAQSTMSNACHWFLRPLSRGKARAGQPEAAPPHRFGVKCQDAVHLALRQKEPRSVKVLGSFAEGTSDECIAHGWFVWPDLGACSQI